MFEVLIDLQNNSIITMNNIKLSIVFALFSFVLCTQCKAQQTKEDEKPHIYKNTMFTGGGLGVQFGNTTIIDISPHFGYYPLENFSVGVGLTYQYINDRSYKTNINVFGGRVFTRLYLPFFNYIYAHGEYEYIAYYSDIFSSNGKKSWYSVNNVLAGIGYRQPITERTSLNFMLLWNLNESEYNLYNNPIFRTSIDIGL
jgi:hypothetical protein